MTWGIPVPGRLAMSAEFQFSGINVGVNFCLSQFSERGPWTLWQVFLLRKFTHIVSNLPTPLERLE